MTQETSGVAQKAALQFAELYRDCAESIGLIHQGKKDWDRPQRALLIRIGIEQARLLAWSQVMGVCELGEYRDPRLDDPHMLQNLQTIVRSMLDRLINVDHGIQLATYGFKPSKKASEALEVALDSTRLESFREQYMLLPRSIYKSWDKATHWTISDNARFASFIVDTRGSVDQLINMMGIQSRIDDCIKQDIRAMGWHPVFDRSRAALDGSKLRLVKDSCIEDYPQYSEATDIPIAYLNVQWSDSYQDSLRMKYPISTAYGSRTTPNTSAAKEPRQTTEVHGRKQSFAGILFKIRSHSWHKHHTSATSDEVPRSNSLTVATSKDTDHSLTPERSRSEGAIMAHDPHPAQVSFADPFNKQKTAVTYSSEV